MFCDTSKYSVALVRRSEPRSCQRYSPLFYLFSFSYIVAGSLHSTNHISNIILQSWQALNADNSWRSVKKNFFSTKVLFISSKRLFATVLNYLQSSSFMRTCITNIWHLERMNKNGLKCANEHFLKKIEVI